MTTLKVLSAGAMKFVVEGLAPRSDATIDSTFGTIATVLKHLEARRQARRADRHDPRRGEMGA